MANERRSSDPSAAVSDAAPGLVLVVDDDPAVLRALSTSLTRQGYVVEPRGDPLDALARIEEAGGSVAVLVTDVQMPGLSGLDLAQRALEADPDLQVIVMTGYGDEAAAQQALRLGASDYLPKPVELSALATSVRRAERKRAQVEYQREATRELRFELRRAQEENQQLTIGVLAVLVKALEARSPYFEGHSQAVATVADGIGRELGLDAPTLRTVHAGALLHDVGMISVPDRIVDKKDALSEDEYRELQLHCQRGADLLDPLESLADVARIILEHHERRDGSGYPLGLERDQISLGGRIVGLAETWVALLEDRPYRTGVAETAAFARLEELGERFDADLVEALRRSQELEREDTRTEA